MGVFDFHDMQIVSILSQECTSQSRYCWFDLTMAELVWFVNFFEGKGDKCYEFIYTYIHINIYIYLKHSYQLCWFICFCYFYHLFISRHRLKIIFKLILTLRKVVVCLLRGLWFFLLSFSNVCNWEDLGVDGFQERGIKEPD